MQFVQKYLHNRVFTFTIMQLSIVYTETSLKTSNRIEHIRCSTGPIRKHILQMQILGFKNESSEKIAFYTSLVLIYCCKPFSI